MKNILISYLSLEWGTSGKKILRDIDYLKKDGYLVYIICLKDSAFKRELDLLSYDHLVLEKTNFISLLILLRNLFKKKNIHIVQTYDLFSLFCSGLILKYYPFVAFFHSHFKSLHAHRSEFWHPFSLARLDKVFVPTDELADDLLDIYPSLEKKVKVTGFGVVQKLNKKNLRQQYRVHKEELLFGVFVQKTKRQKKDIRCMILAFFTVFSQRKPSKQKVRCVFFSSDIVELKREVNFFAQDLGGDQTFLENLLFVEDQAMLETRSDIDFMIALQTRDGLSEEILHALLVGIPILIPRVPHLSFAFPSGGVETYKPRDSRELRSQIEKVLKAISRYKKESQKYAEVFQAKNELEDYYKIILGEHTNGVKKRQRFFKGSSKGSVD